MILLEGGFELIEEKPVLGWGSGAFGRAFFDEVRQTETVASHSEPINVAAAGAVQTAALELDSCQSRGARLSNAGNR